MAAQRRQQIELATMAMLVKDPQQITTLQELVLGKEAPPVKKDLVERFLHKGAIKVKVTQH